MQSKTLNYDWYMNKDCSNITATEIWRLSLSFQNDNHLKLVGADFLVQLLLLRNSVVFLISCYNLHIQQFLIST